MIRLAWIRRAMAAFRHRRHRDEETSNDKYRATLRIVLTSVMVPLLVMELGIWEQERAGSDQIELQLRREALGRVVAGMEARLAAQPHGSGGAMADVQFRSNGQLYGGPYALHMAHEALDDAGIAVAIGRWRTVLPPITIGCAGLTAALSLLALVGAAAVARAGRTSRDTLVSGFSVLRRMMPPLLGMQVLLLVVCTVTTVAFEALAILEVGDFSSGSLKVLAIAAMLIGASLWTGLKAVLQLRRAVMLFTPDPMIILGRPVSIQDAPGLWRMLTDLAEQMDALLPDAVVVGLTGGFFVTCGPKVLQPGEVVLDGRTLYLPLPYLTLLRPDELKAIIGHELAHFSGADTEYSLRFLPIYAGVERSLDAVIAAGTTSAGSLSPLTRPALRLGIFVMDRFHRTVRHWSRQREFEADAAGARVTTADAAARALLRTAAAEGAIEQALDAAFNAPDAASPDLMAVILAHATGQGLDDPSPRLEERQPHPTDTHPPTIQRLAALGHAPDPAALAEAASPPPPGSMARLSALFADPDALCLTATTDFLELGRARGLAQQRALEQAATDVAGEEQALVEDMRPESYVLIGAAILFLLAGLLLMVFGMSGLSWSESRVIGQVAVAIALVLAVVGAACLRRRPMPFLRLRPDGLSLPGLDRAIAWEHVVDLDMAIERGRISTRMLLHPEAPFPARKPGGRRVKLDTPRRIVTFTTALPPGMKAHDLAALLARYRTADKARRRLAATTLSPPSRPGVTSCSPTPSHPRCLSRPAAARYGSASCPRSVSSCSPPCWWR